MRLAVFVSVAVLLLALPPVHAAAQDEAPTEARSTPTATATVGETYACDEYGAGTVTVTMVIEGVQGTITCLGPSPDLPIEAQDGRCAITRVVPGRHTFEAVDETGTPKAAATVTVPEPIFVNVAAVEPPTACDREDGTIVMAAHGARSPFRYRWNGAEENGGATRRDLAPGTHTIVVRDGRGCFETVQVVVPPLADCAGGDG